MFVWLYFLGYLAVLYASILWLQQHKYVQPTIKEEDETEDLSTVIEEIEEVEKEEEEEDAEEEEEEVAEEAVTEEEEEVAQDAVAEELVETQDLGPSLVH